jgi:C-terminal processing protease CtpA/Prc
MNVISPDGETKTYVEPRSVPPIDYASTIIANGMSILNYHSVGIVLKNQQGIFISKDPITNILMFSKVENTRSGPIIVSFNATTIAQIDADTIFSLHYEPKDNSVTLAIIDGHATLKKNEKEIELTTDKKYKHKFIGGSYAI